MDYSTSEYRKARVTALSRTNHTCQFCGMRPAVETHHWYYPPKEENVLPDHLTSLCRSCHDLATTKRRFLRLGGDEWQFNATLEKVLAECDTKSKSKVLDRSSNITERPDSTPAPLPISKRQRSRENGGPTVPRPTTNASGNSIVKRVFGSTRAERLQSRRERSEP